MSDINILFTSVGRRVSLVQTFRDALVQLDWRGRLITADVVAHAPAARVSDGHVAVPRVTNPEYISQLLELCKQESIHLVVPLIDPELPILARYRSIFEDAGVSLLVSSAAVTELCFDKRKTGQFFRSIGIDTPTELGLGYAGDFPVFLKPAMGSGGAGARIVRTQSELEYLAHSTDNPIVQEYVSGTEYTVDVLVDLKGRACSVVPRERLETRAGEVSKGITRKLTDVMEASIFVAESLPGAFGPITLQCFQTSDNRISFIEINPRFGGGYPLSHAAGASFPTWIMQWVKGEYPQIAIDDWEENLLMLRYDDAFFVVDGDSLL